jgi:hypothetical protein
MEISGQLHAPTALPRRSDGPQSRSKRCGEEKNLTPTVIRIPALEPVIIHFQNYMGASVSVTYSEFVKTGDRKI